MAPLKGKILKLSSVLRRRRSSRVYLHRGFTKSIVRLSYPFSGLNAVADSPPAAYSDWHLYSFGPITSGDTSPKDANLEQEDCEETSSGNDKESEEADARIVDHQVSVTTAPPPPVVNKPPQPPVVNKPPPPPVVNKPPPPPVVNKPPPCPAIPPPPAQPNASTTDSHRSSGPQSNAQTPPPAHSEVQGQAIPLLEELDQPSRSVSSRGITARLTTFNDLPINAKASRWMESKDTLDYFRGVYKMGKLPELILHWYQLEEALGFPETVRRMAI